MPNRFLFGATYYPEHWPAENHARDLARIAAAGFNVVRLGEGAWWYWEPREGEYQFELFDRVIDLCRERGIRVVMGTPTYTGPAWIAKNYPEVLRVNFERVVMAHGSRQNHCHTSPKFRDLSRRITTALAEHYKGESQIVAWQLDNEINNGVDASYAASDSIAFRAWLKEKYRTLDALNDAWGARFWSQIYSDWEQVDLPAPTSQWQNPHRLLDHSRFVSASAIAFLREQADILRATNPSWEITHNGLFGNINGPDLAQELDFYSHDHYPLFWKHWSEFSQKLIEARSLTFPFAIMEQQSGPGGQMAYLQRTPEPGEMRLWTYQSIAHGADKLLYFTWRTCPFGSEQHWHGLIDADGKDTRRLAEAAETATEIAALPQTFFDAPPAKVAAVLRDYDNDVNEKRINTYIDGGRWAFGRWAASLAKRHVPTDFLWHGDALDGYALVVACHAKITDDAIVAKLTDFAERGGTVILGAQSGLHDRHLHMEQRTPPGLLADLAGLEVAEWSTLAKDHTRSMTFSDGRAVEAIAFVEALRPTNAIAIAHWKKDDRLLQGRPAVTMRRLGKGNVIYIGAYLGDAATAAVLDWLINTAIVRPAVAASDTVECLVRESSERFTVLLNHSEMPQRISALPSGSVALLGPLPMGTTVELSAFGVSITRADIA